MFRKLMLGAAALAILSLPALAADPTADEIIANNIKAHGGMDKLKAVNTIKMTGKMALGGGLEAPIVLQQKRPDAVRFELSIQGKTAVQAYDGKTGWYIDPFQGKTDASLMGEDDLKEIQEEADFDGPMVDYKAKGNTVELQGKEPVEGSDAYKLKVTLKNGDVRTFFVDPDSWLEIKEESKRTVRGTERETETLIGDYKEVGGIMYPFSIASGVKGGQQKQTITVEKIEQNVPVEDAAFKMPAAAPKAPEAKTDDKKPESKEPKK